MIKRMTNEEKSDIIQEYLETGISCLELGKKFGYHRDSIYDMLRKNNIDTTISRHKIYDINQHYFDVIDTEEKAYILGFLYADGCNSDRGSISISLQYRDIDILEKIKSNLNSTHPISKFIRKENDKNRQDVANLVICNVHMSRQLTKLGCWPRKSLTLEPPIEEQVPKYLLRHWLRGVWDGDGCHYIYYRKGLRPDCLCGVISTLNVCNFISTLLKNEIGINSHIACKNNNVTTRQLQVSGNKQVMKFMSWLYRDATIYLDRKFFKCQEIQNIVLNFQNKIN